LQALAPRTASELESFIASRQEAEAEPAEE
jgi:hypothetical protein